MASKDEIDLKQKGLENFILLILGIVDRRISLLHLEKEVFLLWNFDKNLREYLRFIKHFRGPFSKEIQETVVNPFYLENYWNYTSPRKGDNLSGGYVELSNKGKQEYKKLILKIKEKEEFLHLIAGMKMVRELYDKLTLEELLLLIYDTYPDYTEKSSVYRDIEKKKSVLAERLRRKGIADLKRYNALVG